MNRTKYHINDGFWNRLRTLARTEILPYQWNAMNDAVPDAEPGHVMANLRAAASGQTGVHKGFVFQDSDGYKWLEAAGYALAEERDPTLESWVDEMIAAIAAAQQPDGYINTYYTLMYPDGRWNNLHQAHELYCAGHLMEAAAAHYRATGKRSLLDVAIKFADLIISVFGAPNGLAGYPGHQEVELGLLRLYEVTGDTRYADMAAAFLDRRGQEPYWFDLERESPRYKAVFGNEKIWRAYSQSHQRPAEQRSATGHAVRAVYMYAAMAGLAGRTDDDALTEACRELYHNTVNKQMYITGGIGSQHQGESFSVDYDLPPDTAYAETCASIGLAFFCKRMHDHDTDGRYYDTLERALYNTVLAGVSLTGHEYFYVNPLEVHRPSCQGNLGLAHVKTERQKWFGCACCPPNLARMLLSLHEYIARAEPDGLRLSMYVSGTVTAPIAGQDFTVKVDSGYPYGDTVTLTVTGGQGALYLRNPGDAPVLTLTVDGHPVNFTTEKGYIRLPSVSAGAIMVLTLDMRPRIVYTHPLARHMLGRAAVLRGPLVYCAERTDNEADPMWLRLNANAVFSEKPAPALPNGTVMLETPGSVLAAPDGDALYRTEPPRYTPTTLRLIPYHLWGNRGAGDMMVHLAIDG